MKSVLLCGGSGSRLSPLTRIINKAVLPVYNEPMVFYPIRTLVASGITEILLVCGGNNAGSFLELLGNGEDFGLKHLHYTYQKEAGGIAQALGLAREFVGDSPVCLMLSDNIFENPFPEAVATFAADPVGAHIFLTEVAHPEWYGVVEMKGDKVINIVEKPKQPKSNLIATGLYLYDNTVWNHIDQLEPSARGELEITDLNRYYLNSGNLKATKISGEWLDCGENHDAYFQAHQAAYRWHLAKQKSS